MTQANRIRIFLLLLTPIATGGVLTITRAYAQGFEEQTVRTSIEVLNEIMGIPAQAIPQKLLVGAEGIAIIPRVIKGGFVVGARRGKGTLVVRDDNGNWHAPVFVTLTGGSIGWQAGVQSTDVILVFKTKKSIQGIFANRLTLGVDAAAAAGPVGRQASAATDGQLKAEIYSYARSRGLFLGASFDGSILQVDGMANAAYYHNALGQPSSVPDSARQLVELVYSYSGTAMVPPPATRATNPTANAVPQTVQNQSQETRILAHQYSTHESDVIREQLSRTSPELFEQLAPEWRAYLALPKEVFTQDAHPSIEAIKYSLGHYDQVRLNPQYRQLASSPAFQSTYGLLLHYFSTLSQDEVQLVLPPPPQKQIESFTLQ